MNISNGGEKGEEEGKTGREKEEIKQIYIMSSFSQARGRNIVISGPLLKKKLQKFYLNLVQRTSKFQVVG